MEIFYKNINEAFEIPFDFSKALDPGEVIKTYSVILNSGVITQPSGNVYSFSKYDKSTILIGVSGDVSTELQVNITTNRSNSRSRSLLVDIDTNSSLTAYNDFYYRSFSWTTYSDPDIYILPLAGHSFIRNTEYSTIIYPGLVGITNTEMTEQFSFWFTSEYCPLFATLTSVKLLVGPQADSFTDDTIYRMIMRNSRDVVDMYNMGGHTISYETWGCPGSGFFYEFKRYVECKTAYDLLNILDRVSNTGVAQMKHLGDMTISYGSAPKGSGDGGPTKKDLYNCFNAIVNAMCNIRVAVRGIFDVSKGFPHPVMDPDHNRITKELPIFVEPEYVRDLSDVGNTE